MSKEKDSKSKHNPPNVVAKLMGLETLPKDEPNLSVVRGHRKDYSSQHMYGHLGSPLKHCQVEDRFMDKEMLHEVHPSTEQIAYKDAYEIWMPSQRASNVIPERGRWNDDVDGEKMALIHQKFMEAKHLSTDERLRQSKQFEDALEVLSSNNDLLVRLLDSQYLHELYSTPPNETKRITLVKPLKMVDNEKSAGKRKKNDRMIKKDDKATVWENMNPGYSPEIQKVDEFPVQSTRIVVLKPSPGRTHGLKAMVSPTTSSPRNLQNGDDGVLESIKFAKEITQQIHEGLRSYQKDKNLYSPVFSNGYSGDEGLFNKSSYHDYKAGNFNDLEAMSSLPRLSWDCINGWASPYSTLSLGRASCSPESSVCIEAKKRLSERWSMMASNSKAPQEQRHVKRSSTLGDMLSLSRIKKSVTSQEPSKSVSCRHSFNEEISIGDSPINVPRSNSVPASSTVYETGLSVEVCDHDAGKAHKVLTKSKSMGSSFRGKVKSFLFSRNKKSTKKKSSSSQSKDESQSTASETSDFPILRDDVSQNSNLGGFEECSLAALYESSGKTATDSDSNGQHQDMITIEPGLTESKAMVPEISSENQDQPSPISVLEPPFEDYNTAHESLDYMKDGHQGSLVPLKSNLIDKSPLIESVARTLSWDDSCAPYSLEPLSVSSLDTKVEEQEWLLLVQKLLSAAGLDDQEQYDSFHTRWYSLESPLDPSLRDTYANINDKDPQHLHEAKRRKMRSNQKLVFDCVNAALLEFVGYGSENYFNSSMYSGSHSRPLVQEGTPSPLMDHIVAQMKELIASGMSSVWEDCGDNHSLVVESVVRKEVVQIGWVELMRLEIDLLGREIEGKLIEELVENAVVDFTGRA
ncbi:DUF3741-associated sequence motif [Sesbania bispinosa]|nr:DUF3741-associated sequence motif [Sesbania bispinosa]